MAMGKWQIERCKWQIENGKRQGKMANEGGFE
jgi:hypothetical protein